MKGWSPVAGRPHRAKGGRRRHPAEGSRDAEVRVQHACEEIRQGRASSSLQSHVFLWLTKQIFQSLSNNLSHNIQEQYGVNLFALAFSFSLVTSQHALGYVSTPSFPLPKTPGSENYALNNGLEEKAQNVTIRSLGENENDRADVGFLDLFSTRDKRDFA